MEQQPQSPAPIGPSLHCRAGAHPAPRATCPPGFVRSPALTPPLPPGRAAGIDRLTDLLLGHDTAQVDREVDAALAGGMAVEAIYLTLLAPIARRLGELWVADHCSFTQVAMGTMALQVTLRRLSAAQGPAAGALDPSLRILLMPAPGEQHSFGLVMVAEFFRRAGWQAELTAAMTDGQLAARIGADWYATAALSLAADRHIGALAARIRLLRAESRNRGIAILVGGPVFLARPGLAAELGADGTAADAHAAVSTAFRLLDRRRAPEAHS